MRRLLALPKRCAPELTALAAGLMAGLLFAYLTPTAPLRAWELPTPLRLMGAVLGDYGIVTHDGMFDWQVWDARTGELAVRFTAPPDSWAKLLPDGRLLFMRHDIFSAERITSRLVIRDLLSGAETDAAVRPGFLSAAAGISADRRRIELHWEDGVDSSFPCPNLEIPAGKAHPPVSFAMRRNADPAHRFYNPMLAWEERVRDPFAEPLPHPAGAEVRVERAKAAFEELLSPMGREFWGLVVSGKLPMRTRRATAFVVKDARGTRLLAVPTPLAEKVCDAVGPFVILASAPRQRGEAPLAAMGDGPTLIFWELQAPWLQRWAPFLAGLTALAGELFLRRRAAIAALRGWGRMMGRRKAS